MIGEDSELFIGLITTTGTDTDSVIRCIKDYLKTLNYETKVISVSNEIIPMFEECGNFENEYERISCMMDLGNKIRRETKDYAILMKGVTSFIAQSLRDEDQRIAYIIKSIKHPEEVKYMRDTYGEGFHIIGITSDIDKRTKYLIKRKNISKSNASILLDRDEEEKEDYGQHTRDAFQESDYFITVGNHVDEIENSIQRLMELLFGNPFIFPTFDEYAMFQAFTSSLRSADLSRQVGAVIAINDEIIAQGVNDCPKYGGGLYSTCFDKGVFFDEEGGRDFKFKDGQDSNKKEQQKMATKILDSLNLKNLLKIELEKEEEAKKEQDAKLNEEQKNIELTRRYEESLKLLKKSGLNNLTEYGRVVHAEMEALLMCSRNNISSRNAMMYVTTFPCHNCAKHIIAAGIKKVIYIEPYPKSKTFEFYPNEITSSENISNKIQFVPFTGVGPHKFVDLFAMDSTRSEKKVRKDDEGNKIKWDKSQATLRNKLPKLSYKEYEKLAYEDFANILDEYKERDNNE